MLLDKRDLSEVWTRIKGAAAANPDAITVLILVALDVDALAACEVLTKLLEGDEISHNVKPVRDYGRLADIYMEDCADNHELQSIVLLNCGGVIDLFDHLQARLDAQEGESTGGQKRQVEDQDCVWYVVDSHRPYNIANVSRGPKLQLVGDDEDDDLLDELIAQQHVLNDPEFVEFSLDEDDEPPTQRRRVSATEYAQLSPDSRESQYRQLKHLESRYYSASWYGTSSAVLAYSLVQELSRSSNEMLWLAVVGLTDQLVHERIQYEKYVGVTQLLQEEVESLNQQGVSESAELRDAETGTIVSVRQHMASKMRLESVQELHLCMLRHWSLYEALTHSRYIFTRLGLHGEHGRFKLDQWLARMGIPLEEAKQQYSYMKPQVREELHERMEQYGPENGLTELTYPSFRRVTNYSSTVSAADLVYCVNAQLEQRPPEPPKESAAAGADERSLEETQEAEESATAVSFSLAQAALSTGGSGRQGSQKEGFEKAKNLLRSLVSQGRAIITQKQYHDLSDFWQVTLRPSAEAEQFTHAQSITKLALFVADALRRGKAHVYGENQLKPVLLAAPMRERTHLVVAVLGSSRNWQSSSGKNSFSAAFQTAAYNATARVALDGFESCVCEVASDDLENFYHDVTLHYCPR